MAWHQHLSATRHLSCMQKTTHQSGIARRSPMRHCSCTYAHSRSVVAVIIRNLPVEVPASHKLYARTIGHRPFGRDSRVVLSVVTPNDWQTQSSPYTLTVPPDLCRLGRGSAPRSWFSLRFFRRIIKFESPEDTEPKTAVSPPGCWPHQLAGCTIVYSFSISQPAISSGSRHPTPTPLKRCREQETCSRGTGKLTPAQ